MLERDLGPQNRSAQTSVRQISALSQRESGPNGLSDPGNLAAYCSAWLSQQMERMPSVATALLIVRGSEDGATLLSIGWPQDDHPDAAMLRRLADQAWSERHAVVTPAFESGSDVAKSPAKQGDSVIALPIGAGSEQVAVIAVKFSGSAGDKADHPGRIAERLRWGAGWLAVLPWVRRLDASKSDMDKAIACLDLVAAVGGEPRLAGMTIGLANDIASRLGCDRVCVGLVRPDGAVRLNAISNSATFKREARLIEAIETAMEEAVDQRAMVAFPALPATERTVAVAHRTLVGLSRAASASVVTVLLPDNQGNVIGAITLERESVPVFDQQTSQLAEAMAAMVGPLLALQIAANRLIAGRIVDSIRDILAKLFGPRRPVLKLGAIAVVAVVAVLSFAKSEYYVTAKTVLEPEIQRAAVAPFDGFVLTAPVRAGDTVRRGDLLVALDERDLRLEVSKWTAERDKLLEKQRDALAERDRSNFVMLDAQIQQAASQLALARDKLSRAHITAPFDGIVASGDLSQKIGSPIEKGQTLFEIAPLASYRLILHVDERDIRFVTDGQKGTVALTGLPWSPLPLVVTRITPVTLAEEGRNSFRVEARLARPDGRLRPGMEGVAKLRAGRRLLVWTWTRASVDWLRLIAWRYLP